MQGGFGTQIPPANSGAAGNRLLAALSPEDYGLLAPHLFEMTLDPDKVLQEPGQPIQRIYFPTNGIISLSAVSTAGSGIYTAIIGREGALGLTAGIGSRSAIGRAVVHAPLRTISIAQPRFAEAAAQSQAIREMIARYSDLLMAQVLQTVLCSTFHRLQSRVCRWLLHARDAAPTDVIVLTQQYLSAMLGARRTSINMVIGELQNDGVVEVRRGRVMIRDVDQLKRKSCPCYAAVRDLINSGPDSGVSLQPAGPNDDGLSAAKAFAMAHSTGD